MKLGEKEAVNNSESDQKESGGILSQLKRLFERNRLGELLVQKGHLSPSDLRKALDSQRVHSLHLGHVLVEHKLVSRKTLYNALIQQWGLRCLATAATLFFTFAGTGIKTAKASGMRDIPAQVSLVSTANAAFTPVKYYPALFGSEEKRSSNITPFTKWTTMFDRFDRSMNSQKNASIMANWKENLRDLQGKSLKEMANSVNNMVNETKYIVDSRNWGKSDYWATPVEFFQRGGDCEDFAIAKYTSLRALGVPEERLRIAIVHDKLKNIPHAVLIVYTDGGAYILDNQNKRMQASDQVSRYRPIFTINRQAWWLHTQPTNTVVASR